MARDAGRSTDKTTFFRNGTFRVAADKKQLLAGDSFPFQLPYVIDSKLYWRNLEEQLGLFDEVVRARAYIEGDLAATVERGMKELQNF